MRKITIVGAGQGGLQLAIGLAQAGYEVTCVSNRTPEEVRRGRVTSNQFMAESSLVHERALGINFWDATCPRIEALSLSTPHPELRGAKGIDFSARFDRLAQSVDQRVKFSRWMEHLASLGGELRFQDATVADLEEYARRSDLVIVASGKGVLGQLFARDAAHSPYDRPMRALTLAYVNGMEHLPDATTDHVSAATDVGEYFVLPAETVTGPCHIMVFEGIPGGPLDAFADATTPGEILARAKQLIATHFPWEIERHAAIEITDPSGFFTGRFAPVVRAPTAVLPSGWPVLGMGDAVVLNDPISGQGSGNAAKAAAAYLASIRERGDAPFDVAWMQATFGRLWDELKHITEWSNMSLGPMPPHVAELLGAACTNPKIAHRWVNAYDRPEDLRSWYMTPESAQAYLREVSAAS